MSFMCADTCLFFPAAFLVLLPRTQQRTKAHPFIMLSRAATIVQRCTQLMSVPCLCRAAASMQQCIYGVLCCYHDSAMHSARVCTMLVSCCCQHAARQSGQVSIVLVSCCYQDAAMQSCCVVLLPGCSKAISSCPHHAGKRNPLMVKMVPMDGHLLLQWMAPKSFKEPRLLDLDVNNYVDAPSDTAGDGMALSALVRSVQGVSCRQTLFCLQYYLVLSANSARNRVTWCPMVYSEVHAEGVLSTVNYIMPAALC